MWGAVLLFLIGAIVGTGATILWARRAGVVKAAVAGLVAQGAITVALYHLVGLWAPDAIVYHQLGQEFAAYWSGGPEPSAVSNGKEAFPVMLGAVYLVVGPASAIGLLINWLAHGLLVPALATMARRADLPVRPAAWLAALFPPALFWSALLLREAITWLLTAIFLTALLGLTRRIAKRDLVAVVVSLLALLWFRGTAAIIVAGVGTAVLLLTARRRTLVPRLGVALLIALVLSPRLAPLLVGYTSVDQIEAMRTDLNNADTSFAGKGDPAPTPDPGAAPGDGGAVDPVAGGEPSSLVDSLMRVALGPYPWEWPSLGGPFALDGVLWLAVIALGAVGWWRSGNRVRLLVVILPALALSGALMLTSGNYGTMQRLRVQTTTMLLPLAAAGAVGALGAVRGAGRRREASATASEALGPQHSQR